jgi:hypothetical protein
MLIASIARLQFTLREIARMLQSLGKYRTSVLDPRSLDLADGEEGNFMNGESVLERRASDQWSVFSVQKIGSIRTDY